MHIRIQQRNGRKCVVTVQGLADNLNLRQILKALKKTCHTNGAIINDEALGPIVQLQGDQRANVRDFLEKYHICGQTQIVVHGF